VLQLFLQKNRFLRVKLPEDFNPHAKATVCFKNSCAKVYAEVAEVISLVGYCNYINYCNLFGSESIQKVF